MRGAPPRSIGLFYIQNNQNGTFSGHAQPICINGKREGENGSACIRVSACGVYVRMLSFCVCKDSRMIASVSEAQRML